MYLFAVWTVKSDRRNPQVEALRFRTNFLVGTERTGKTLIYWPVSVFPQVATYQPKSWYVPTKKLVNVYPLPLYPRSVVSVVRKFNLERWHRP